MFIHYIKLITNDHRHDIKLGQGVQPIMANKTDFTLHTTLR